MGETMNFPSTWEQFLHDYEFEDARRIYTNGSHLIPSFRVKQMIEHYFRPEEVEHIRLALMGKSIAEIKEFDGLTIGRIRELAEADKEGRVAVLPCKVGDRLYEVTGRKTISVYKVRAIRVELFGLFIEWDIVEGFVWQSPSDINADEIGKTVFLTRNEAEAALRRTDNG